MPSFQLPDGKAISLDSNLPIAELPADLQARLGSVLADLRAFLKTRSNFPEKGTILVDEQGNRVMAGDLDVDEFVLGYLVNGFFERIRKDGKLGAVIPVRSDPWSNRDADVFENNKADGRHYRILGKYVDYDHD